MTRRKHTRPSEMIEPQRTNTRILNCFWMRYLVFKMTSLILVAIINFYIVYWCLFFFVLLLLTFRYILFYDKYIESTKSSDLKLHGLTTPFQIAAAIITVVIFTYLEKWLYSLCKVLNDNNNYFITLTYVTSAQRIFYRATFSKCTAIWLL